MEVPPIQALVKNKNTGLPGSGVGYAAPDAKGFREASTKRRREIVNLMLPKVYGFIRWDDVLRHFKLALATTPTAPRPARPNPDWAGAKALSTSRSSDSSPPTRDAPVWTRHDHPRLAGEPRTSHASARNLKLYAKEAGITHVHQHQTQHTFVRIVAEETGSMTATQDALDHANLSTTTVYVQRISVKRDLHSAAVARRWKGEPTS